MISNEDNVINGVTNDVMIWRIQSIIINIMKEEIQCVMTIENDNDINMASENEMTSSND